jgi:hypothetical protein
LAKVRWFSPGETITGDEVVWEIWQQIQRARRQGLSIERIVFDAIENAPIALPSVAKEPLFWTTLLQMISAEAITTFLGISLENDHRQSGTDNLMYTLRSEADYVLRVGSGSREKSAVSPDVLNEESSLPKKRGRGGTSPKLPIVVVEKCPEEMRVTESLSSEDEGTPDSESAR